MEVAFKNPFRPGAGHMPPYLAGREAEINEFRRLLLQDVILENLILTGLRGVGKTVLLDTLKPVAIAENWLWVGTDLSESSSVSEQNMATRLMADLSVVTSSVTASAGQSSPVGFTLDSALSDRKLTFDLLVELYNRTPGLVTDKLKSILEIAWASLAKQQQWHGIIFAYDEAQNLADHAAKDQFPLSTVIDTFQSIQRKGVPCMLVLTGLPTLFPKLVEARTYSERMFHLLFLKRLNQPDSRDAILKPIQDAKCPIMFGDPSVEIIVTLSGGYPYFIQFICREAYDVFIQKLKVDEPASVPTNEIIRKLDADFFAGRWARATDRQRDLLTIAALSVTGRPNCEFTVQDIVEQSQRSAKPFASSNVNQMLASLCEAGLVYKDRHGKYLFAVPLLDMFILRQMAQVPDAPPEPTEKST